ncbi:MULTISPECIES: nucleoside triphosphate pyrophosphohydrolase family protein [Xenorhabdus]|uniref:nucleoside triphosphate pyrophosphohydrolase family protein n=1 Tax=Xenorhabdus TaxID=626 RepID=UPI00069CA5A6|nr:MULTISPECIES: nucleoside triphosphate pyrophosphohydrolase family protein [Xenorhabdus]
MKINNPTLSLKPTDKTAIAINNHIKPLYELVKEFHQVFGHPIDETEITSEMLYLRANLIREEAEEGLTALDEGNAKEILDAVGDTVYVLVGTLVVIKNSMSHALSLDHSQLGAKTVFNIMATETGSCFVRDLETGFNLAITTAGLLVDIADYLDAGEGVSACEGISCLPDYISDCLVVFRHVLHLSGVPLYGLTQAIHESNMSKLWSADTETRKSQVANCKYNPADLAFRTCLSRDGVIGYRISDGKILKSPSYTPVDLMPFIEQCNSL